MNLLCGQAGAWAGRWACGHVRGRAKGKAKTKRSRGKGSQRGKANQGALGGLGLREGGGEHHGGTCINCYPKRLQFLHHFAGVELQTDANMKMTISYTKLRGNAINYTRNGLLFCRRI